MNIMLPGNPRYQPKQLVPFFGYDSLYRPVVEVEVATLETLAEIGVIPPHDMKLLTREKREQLTQIVTTEVDRVERETKHDIRALVRIMQEVVGPRLGRWIHVPLTSYDPLATARVLQFKRAHEQVVMLSVLELMQVLADRVRVFADVLQIGRTHGQHALPITVGFWLATILDRIMRNLLAMDYHAEAFEGKISGAVGAHNAQYALGFADLCGDVSFEERVLMKLGIKPAPISTQILPPEGLAYYLFSCTMMTASLAQLGRDGRNLMRSEIAEIGEPFGATQVGSSTMAHKRNPIKFENLEGMHKKTLGEFLKVKLTLISEHQRDLTDSSVARDFPIVVVNLQQQLNTLLRRDEAGTPWLSRVTVNEAALERNFEASSKVILAEPIYIALQMAGYEGDAHELVNRTLMPLVQSTNMPLFEALVEYAAENEQVSEALERIPSQVCDLLGRPWDYVGDAAERAHAVADRVKEWGLK